MQMHRRRHVDRVQRGLAQHLVVIREGLRHVERLPMVFQRDRIAAADRYEIAGGVRANGWGHGLRRDIPESDDPPAQHHSLLTGD